MSSTSDVIFRQAISAALRELREQRGLSPDEVWAATGIGPRHVLAMERAERALDFAEAIYIANAYRTTLDEINMRAEEIVEDWVQGGSRIGHSLADQGSAWRRSRRGEEGRQPPADDAIRRPPR